MVSESYSVSKQKAWFSFSSASKCPQLIAIVSSRVRIGGNVFTYFRGGEPTAGMDFHAHNCSDTHIYILQSTVSTQHTYGINICNIWNRDMSYYYVSDVNTEMRLCGNEFVYSLCVLCGRSTQHTEYKDEKYPFHINSKYGSINKHQQSVLLFSDRIISNIMSVLLHSACILFVVTAFQHFSTLILATEISPLLRIHTSC